MAVWIFALVLVLFCGTDSLAQVYKYKDKDGNIVFTDIPPSGLVKDGEAVREEKAREPLVSKKRSGGPVKDVNQLGEEMLAEELAKPPGKQDKRLIQELQEILYGDASGKKVQTIKEPEAKETSFFSKTPAPSTKKQ